MSKEVYQDDIIVLQVKDWQTADKFAVCFSRNHGKVSFVAYGARYGRSNGGRLVQPFAALSVKLLRGKRFDTLQQCELNEVPATMDIETLAYAAVIGEVIGQLTEEYEEQEAIFILLEQALKILPVRNKRIIVVSTLCKLLTICGFSPQLKNCTSCGREVVSDAYFSVVQGGIVCDSCMVSSELPFADTTRHLMSELLKLDFNEPPALIVKGADLMQLEQTLYKFLIYQTSKPLRSLKFLKLMGL
ncbi:MAG TPA: DNA repair protein RecO [Candidatus Avacidaminococcus intestinavium]|uniref:DNA repair protein RecO n=1 Tax=Candidatus Avacidaminococcus intestinavium TaxID=2840684 RepID=A0A9D1MPW3_9FIRM|nr:DNA repair protein RecO [Candidatus Avacidaminococcus intestinavium]